jgi:hypothetical protein
MPFVVGTGQKQRRWSCARDRDGNREYKIVYRVFWQPDAGTMPDYDGPAAALQAVGLPQPGDPWTPDDDYPDPWAFCRQDANVTPVTPDDGGRTPVFDVELTFSTKNDEKRCKDVQIDNPLDEPIKVSGSFVKAKEEALKDRFGQPIVNSAWEQFRGPQVEFDTGTDTVRVEMNVAALNLPLLAALKNHVNDRPVWGMPKRCVRFANYDWDRLFYGACTVYYRLKLDLEVDSRTFDRDLLDEAQKVLHGHWKASEAGAAVAPCASSSTPGVHTWVLDPIDGGPPNPYNPSHFIRFTDPLGNAIRGVLNGRGLPAGVCIEGCILTGETTELHPGLLTGTAFGGAGEGGPFGAGTRVYMATRGAMTGVPVEDYTGWAELRTGALSLPDWVVGTTYHRGDLVRHFEGGVARYYLANSEGVGGEPPGEWWVQLPSGVPVDKGEWSATATYNLGDYVVPTTASGPAGTGTAPCDLTREGRRHVEYYPEGNLLLLGIPTVL